MNSRRRGHDKYLNVFSLKVLVECLKENKFIILKLEI